VARRIDFSWTAPLFSDTIKDDISLGSQQITNKTRYVTESLDERSTQPQAFTGFH
jgi:hypothetical protein